MGVYLDYFERDSKKEKLHPISFMRSNFQYLRQGKCWLSLLVTVTVYPDMCSLNEVFVKLFLLSMLTGGPFITNSLMLLLYVPYVVVDWMVKMLQSHSDSL